MSPANPFGTAIFIVLAMGFAGVAHVLWLRTALARSLTACVDGGVTVRGRRLFGDNKKIRGFLVMPAAAALTFGALGAVRELLPPWLAAGIWPLSTGGLALLGFIAGLAFMLAELPNSFLKRQFGIAPGLPATRPLLRKVFFVVDRCDSVLGTLLALSLCVPVPLPTWLWVLLLGPCLHAFFSAVLFHFGVKARAL